MDNHQNRSRLAAMVGGIACILFFLSPARAQTGLIPETYLRIIPGVSTRSDVEKLYGKRDSNRYFWSFELPDQIVGIQFSSGTCDSKLSNSGLPEWTVEEVYFDWPKTAKRMLLREVVLEPRRFQRRQLGDVLGHDYYVNDEFGIEVVHDRGLKEVLNIHLKPSAKITEKYRCASGRGQSWPR